MTTEATYFSGMPCWTCAQAMVIGPLVWHRVPVGSSSAWKCESMDHSQKKRRRKKHKAAIACRECQITGWNTRWNKKHRWSMWYNTFAYFFIYFFNDSSKEFLNKSGLLVTSQSIGFLWYMCIHFFCVRIFLQYWLCGSFIRSNEENKKNTHAKLKGTF